MTNGLASLLFFSKGKQVVFVMPFLSCFCAFFYAAHWQFSIFFAFYHKTIITWFIQIFAQALVVCAYFLPFSFHKLQFIHSSAVFLTAGNNINSRGINAAVP